MKAQKFDLLPKMFDENFHGVVGEGFFDKETEVRGFTNAILLSGGGVITASVEDSCENIIGLIFNPTFDK